MKKQDLTNAELSSFFDNMAVMLRAGISTDEALHLLQEDNRLDNERVLGCLKSMADSMEEGKSFAEAVTESGAFPGYAVHMLESAEYTGRLEETLRQLGDYYRGEERTQTVLMSAVRYPISLLTMIIVLLIVMLAMVFPTFNDVYENLSGSLAASSYRYIHAAFAGCWVLLVIMILCVALLLFGLRAWRKGDRAAVRKKLGKIRMFAQIFEGFDLYRFTSCFNMFIASGSLQDEALKRAAEATETEELKAKLEACCTDMEEGQSFSQAAYGRGLYDPVSSRLLIPAERSGNLDAVLGQICEGLRQQNEESISRIANTIEPFLTGLLLISVGLMLIALMVPLIGIMNSIG